MLEEAQKKHIPRLVQADGLQLPFRDQGFDALSVAFGLRNMADRHKSLTEMRRILRPDGRLIVLEFSQPYFWFRPFYYAYLKYLLPSIAAVVTASWDRASGPSSLARTCLASSGSR